MWKTFVIMNIGEHIRNKRKQKGLSINELAVMLGISATAINFYENGKRNPKEIFFIKWQKVFNEEFKTDKNVDYNVIKEPIVEYAKSLNNNSFLHKNETISNDIKEMKISLKDILEFQKALMVNIDTYLEPLLNDLGKRNGEENLPSKLRSSAALKLQKVLEMDI